MNLCRVLPWKPAAGVSGRSVGRSFAPRCVMDVALIAVVLLAACGGGNSSNNGGGNGGGSNPPPTNTGISVFPGVTNVPAGGTAIFSAYIPSNPSTKSFTWSVSGTGSGTITTDGNGNGHYTAPTTAPTSAVTVSVKSGNLGGSATVTVTSASAQGIAVSPAAVAVSAGTVLQFAATASGAPTTVTQWQVNGTPGGDNVFGTIDANGNYTAPVTPPPGAATTITAITATGSATAIVAIVFSNSSLNGAYTFSYTGDDGSAFLAAAGSFTAINGAITGGEDRTNTKATASGAITGIYNIGPDGRGTATIAGGPNSGETWSIALTANSLANGGQPVQHALLIRLDSKGTGSGTLDHQDTIAAGSPFPLGSYVFQISGLDGAGFADKGGFELGAAGRFFSNGGGVGNAAVWDLNDAGASAAVQNDSTLTAAFSLASNGFTGSVGRGTLSFSSTNSALNALTKATTNSTFTFVFYVVDNTHIKVVENDGKAFLSGDIYSEPAPPYAVATILQSSNYAFTSGGMDGKSPYTVGGVFRASGGATSSTGVVDVNNTNNLSLLLDKSLSVFYSADPSTGRMNFTFTPATTPSTTLDFVGYRTSAGRLLLLQTDAGIVTTGFALPQSASAEPAGNYAANISGTSGKGQQDLAGQVSIVSGNINGTFDFNDVLNGKVYSALALTSTALVAPDTNGRGTFSLQMSAGTFPLAYYVVDNKTVLMLEIDAVHVTRGIFVSQF